ISLYRESDKVLISGDAFVSTKAESAISVLTDRKEVSGPPKYLTTDWNAAEQSVKKLAALKPDVIATGHGKPMRGEGMRNSLHNLAENFIDQAKPSHGRYVDEPVVADENGIQYIPPHNSNSLLLAVTGITVLAVLGIFFYKKKQKNVIPWKEISKKGYQTINKKLKHAQAI
ncbi:MAG TPA: MBL fold metallo-hydrolase, partial [Flavitalea sp.]|nr:MBL fold metallo-hydrolase [Flavitalea sp.]